MIKFNEVTWYSRLGTIIFFLAIVPVFAFHIGVQYEKAQEVTETIYPPHSPPVVKDMKTQGTQTSALQVLSLPISLTAYNRGVFKISSSLSQGSEIVIRWTSDAKTRAWGDHIDICLLGLNDKKELIDLRENKELCYPTMQVIVGSTTVSSGEYYWKVSKYSNKFIEPPASFKLSLTVVDSLRSAGRTEWAGLISDSTSNEFTIE